MNDYEIVIGPPVGLDTDSSDDAPPVAPRDVSPSDHDEDEYDSLD